MNLSQVITVFTVNLIAHLTLFNQPGNSYSVCGLEPEAATFRTETYLITVCFGEASFQGIITYLDGTGYQRVALQKEGDRFVGSDEQYNYTIEPENFIIDIDGAEAVQQEVIEANIIDQK